MSELTHKIYTELKCLGRKVGMYIPYRTGRVMVGLTTKELRTKQYRQYGRVVATCVPCPLGRVTESGVFKPEVKIGKVVLRVPNSVLTPFNV